MKKRRELTPSGERNLCFASLAAVILLGVAAGASLTAAHGTEWAGERIWLHQYFSPMLCGETILGVFKNTFLTAGFFALTMFVLGFFSIGQPLCIALTAARGLGIGAAAAQLYIENGFGAVTAISVLVLPKALALSLTAILGAREMLRLSGVQFSFLFSDNCPEESMQRLTKLYCVKFAVIIIMIAIVSVADSAVNYFFADLY